MDVRDARPEDAEAACRVIRRSIIELCEADHRRDPTLLSAWLGNKTPETVAGWMRRADASYLIAIDRGAMAAVGAVTDAGEILLNYVSPDARFRGASATLLAALEARAAERGAKCCTLVSTETARRFYRARGYAETDAPTRKFGMESGYPMAKALPAEAACSPTDGFILRRLTPQDAGAAADVIRAAFRAQRIATRPPSSALAETRETAAAKLAAGGGFGVFAKQRLAAVALWRLDDGVFLIGRVAVLRNERAGAEWRAPCCGPAKPRRKGAAPRGCNCGRDSNCRRTSNCSRALDFGACGSKRMRGSASRPGR